jgi:RNA polymerase-binding protein DksA
MPAKRSRRATPAAARRSRPRVRPRAVSKARAAAPAGRENGGRGASRGKGPAPRREMFTRLLMGERRRLLQELSQMEEHQVKTEEKTVADASGYEDDLVDVATETFEREKGLALESSVQGLLEMVEEALRRIREGTYGICDSCGRPIDANRLRAIPYTRLCIRCKEREERARAAR